MNGIKKKGRTQVTCRGCQGHRGRSCYTDRLGKAVSCEAAGLVQYGAYYIGFADKATGWEGVDCMRVAASVAAHKRFIAGRSEQERRGRIGVVLEALGTLEYDDAKEVFVNLTAKVRTKPPRLKVMMRKCTRYDLYYLVFLLPEEAAPGATCP